VALPTVSEDGPHISIRKQAPDVMTPVDLLKRDSLPTELVAMVWQLYEHHGVVLFCGPTGVGKTTLMNAVFRRVPLWLCSRYTQELLVVRSSHWSGAGLLLTAWNDSR